jgi:hypothetical protein
MTTNLPLRMSQLPMAIIWLLGGSCTRTGVGLGCLVGNSNFGFQFLRGAEFEIPLPILEF